MISVKRRTKLIKQLTTNILLILLIGLFMTSISFSEEKGKKKKKEDKPAFEEKAALVYLDGFRWDESYIKTEIPFVNYIRDRTQAHVHIMLNSQRTGAGGNEYTITFYGQHQFANMSDTLQYVSKQMDAQETTRQQIVRLLKIGLMPFVAKTPQADYIAISYRKKTNPVAVKDKWNNWVFFISGSADLEFEASDRQTELDAAFSAERVTPDWRISLAARSDYNLREIEDYSYVSRNPNFKGLIVRSINEHWSYGGYGSAISSDSYNTKLAMSLAPAIEFNVYPYSLSTRKQFRFLYKPEYINIAYKDTTIYFKTEDQLFKQTLSGTLALRDKWGSTDVTLEGSHYFHDFAKLRLRLSGRINLRLFGSLSLDLSGSIAMIRDDLSLRKGSADVADVLTQVQRLASDYNINTRIGFRYTFGSIYSSVVNPRFGGGGRGRRY
jgi:hypothetical protein